MEEKNKKMNGNDVESKLDRFRLLAGLLQRYYNGQATPKEKQIIDAWDAQSAWEKHRIKVNNRKMDAACDEVWNNISSQLHFEKKHKTIRPGQLFHRYAAAAVLFILLGGGILFLTQHNSFNRSEYGAMADANTFFQTTDAQTKQVTLPDGSRIHLNRGTKISYASNAFNRRQREVWLSGEAFFEVAKNPEKPFIIHTGDMITTVKGTSFNVKAYPQLSANVVTVLTGKVEVKTKDKVLAMLTPDKQLEYNKKTNASQLMDIDADEVTGWQSGGLILNYADKDELKLRIKQHYNADIQFRNNALDNIKIKSTFVESTTLNDVLGTIEALYDVRCTSQSNQIIIDKQ
ncbi:MAG: iron dicitrate transport regulator FecR [Bacteroidetes bacterium]|nr:iron dicitrate transport regulator FecR [Bacteroidota bacterium]